MGTETFSAACICPSEYVSEGRLAPCTLSCIFARVIQRFLGLTVDHPGTMFCNMVFNIVGFCSGAIVAVFALVWPFLLMLTFNVFFQRCSGTESLASIRGSVTYNWVSLLVSKPEMACKVRFSWLYNTTNMTNIFFGTLPSNWWFLCASG